MTYQNGNPTLRDVFISQEWGNWSAIYEQSKVMQTQPVLESRCCPNSACSSEPWTVQLLSADNPLWRVSSTNGDGSYLVAGNTPACPFCGTTINFL